jgi:hypothetical protein
MAKKTCSEREAGCPRSAGGILASGGAVRTPGATHRFSVLVRTRVIYCGNNLDQLHRLPDTSVEFICIDPPFNSNRDYEVFWGEAKEERVFEDRYASTQAFLDYVHPSCMELACALKKTGSSYCHCNSHSSHYVNLRGERNPGRNAPCSSIRPLTVASFR